MITRESRKVIVFYQLICYRYLPFWSMGLDISQSEGITQFQSGAAVAVLGKGAVTMTRYRVYCKDKLIAEDLKSTEVEKLTGIPSGNVKFYAETGQIKRNLFRVECDDITEEQLSRFEDSCRAAQLLKTGNAVIRLVNINGNAHKRTVRR